MTIDLKGTGILDADGDILTRSGGNPVGISRASLAADAAFTSRYGLLAYKTSSTGSSVAATSSSFVDVDATEQSVTFTVPPSGAVLIRVTARVNIDNAHTYEWNLREGSSDVAGTNQIVIYHDAGGTIQARLSAAFIVSGLTPAASKTYKLGHARTFGAGNTDIRRGSGDPVVMEVWAA